MRCLVRSQNVRRAVSPSSCDLTNFHLLGAASKKENFPPIPMFHGDAPKDPASVPLPPSPPPSPGKRRSTDCHYGNLNPCKKRASQRSSHSGPSPVDPADEDWLTSEDEVEQELNDGRGLHFSNAVNMPGKDGKAEEGQGDVFKFIGAPSVSAGVGAGKNKTRGGRGAAGKTKATASAKGKGRSRSASSRPGQTSKVEVVVDSRRTLRRASSARTVALR